ncbi:unnamed protein product [Dovyalis caffra]|uniref:NAC domain-containing protein n=1 Tax=Dovyalis caffra TaxID=77055 RepID=A0AAV1RRC0_9ROSI|nr:unnamed protein product [Dovyalis caffra]
MATKNHGRFGMPLEGLTTRTYSSLPISKMSPTTSRTNHQVGSSGGTWHDEGRYKRSGWLGIQWVVKTFNYKNPKSKARNGAWMMHEYDLVANDIVGTPTVTVVCRLRKKQPGRKRRLDDEEESDDDMDKNCKRSTCDRVAMSTTTVS